MKYNENFDLYKEPSYNQADFSLKHLMKIRYELWLGKEQFMRKTGRNVLGPERIKKYLEEKGIDISKATAESLYDPCSARSSIDITSVLLLCEWWQLDPAHVLAFPGQESIPSPAELKGIDKNRRILSDKNYHGTFYCYFFRISGTDSSFTNAYPNSLPKREDLMEGTLTFDISDEMGTTATFTYTQRVRDFNRPPRLVKKSATCVPYESAVNHNVFLEFVDNDGRWYEIIFDHQQFTNSPCYFRIAGMITEASEKDHLPVFQKMVFFREKPDDSFKPYIRGFLNHNPNNILIGKAELEALSGINADGSETEGKPSEDEELRDFYRYYRKILEPHLREIYVFNESIITKEPSGMSEFEAKKALLKLRHKTFSQNQLYIGMDADAHRIAKYLQNQGEEMNDEEE